MKQVMLDILLLVPVSVVRSNGFKTQLVQE